ncbi:hypothetical protein IF2G_10915 [Cordyceps javanica]|nr:hypothetical protein IF2G_10915 [Cordyceps javanica]
MMFTRGCFSPLKWLWSIVRPPPPYRIIIVGGLGTGKSTVSQVQYDPTPCDTTKYTADRDCEITEYSAYSRPEPGLHMLDVNLFNDYDMVVFANRYRTTGFSKTTREWVEKFNHKYPLKPLVVVASDAPPEKIGCYKQTNCSVVFFQRDRDPSALLSTIADFQVMIQ